MGYKFFAQVFSLFHTSLLLKSFSFKFFAQVLVPFSVKTRFEQQSTFSPLLQQQQRFLFHPISLVISIAKRCSYNSPAQRSHPIPYPSIHPLIAQRQERPMM